MPVLNWSPSALAAVRDKGQREAMTRLFDAYFRVAEGKDLTGTVLHLDPPAGSSADSILQPPSGVARSRVALPAVPLVDPKRYYFSARFMKNNGWVVYATLKREYRIMSKAAEGSFGPSDFIR